ncbi:putative rhs element Vgr protein [Burkholderia thailandensis]|uniref:Rhs element Vgr protein n=1 Tax=Burkholderia thailandensis TaxID=57975 RepID=A0AAW9CZW1_BURTH|nr:putative rhs element Vgr protein [Burkholderia thailandensis]MDW9254583.1 putative rhs element Vgr protein [Burkholderia thailandensis]
MRELQGMSESAAAAHAGGLAASAAQADFLKAIDPTQDGKYTSAVNGQSATKASGAQRDGGEPVERFAAPAVLMESPENIVLTTPHSAVSYAAQQAYGRDAEQYGVFPRRGFRGGLFDCQRGVSEAGLVHARNDARLATSTRICRTLACAHRDDSRRERVSVRNRARASLQRLQYGAARQSCISATSRPLSWTIELN